VKQPVHPPGPEATRSDEPNPAPGTLSRSDAPPVWRRILDWARHYRPPEEGVLLVTAMIVGFSAGIGAVAFRWLIATFTSLSFDWLPSVTSNWGHIYLIIAPVIGGLLIGPLIYYFAPEARGHGVPEVMEAVTLRDGRIRPIVAAVKSLASSICIGSGGSVGREGPIVQIGSALGSTLGQVLHLSRDRVRNLVACGAAAGIAATFNAPIAGALFALEVILADFSAQTFGTVVIASVTASVVGRAAFGDVPAFAIPEYAIRSPWEFPLYLLLGVLAAVLATIYTRAIYRAEDLFDSWKQPPVWLKPAIGGLLLGCIAWTYRLIPGLGYDRIPQVYGVGYGTIEAALNGQHLVLAMLAIMVLKVVATSLTLGSGGSGGVFAPSLFIGAMLGGSFALLMQMIWPDLVGSPGAYALAGMGAVFAAATNASLTAIIIMFEMTGDYKIILPLMLSVVVATVLSRRLLNHESIYTMKLSRRGVRLEHGRNIDILRGVRVHDVMTTKLVRVHPDDPLPDLSTLFLRTNRHAFVVVDGDGRLCGIVSLSDLRKAVDSEGADSEGGLEPKRVADIMTSTVVTAFPDETVDVVLKRMGPRDLSRLPVVTRQDPHHLVGVIRRNDIVRAYNIALARQAGATGS